MTATLQATPNAMVESIARTLPPSARDDFRNLMNLVVLANLTALAPGGNLLQAGGAQPGSSTAPVGVTFGVTGGNGVFTVAIADPPAAKANPIWHEVSYGPLASFTQNVTTMPATTNASVTIPAPGQSYYFRLRSSFDKQTWSAYQLASTVAIDAGLVTASAMSAAAAFNQTNYGVVNSQASGSSALVTVSGTGGTLTSYPAVRGTTQAVRPSATVVGVTPGSEQFVGWDGTTFVLKPTLASVLADELEPVGRVSVVSTAAPTLPVINAILSGGGIVGYDVVSGGSGASQPYTLTIFDSGGGSGATAGQQTIVAGVLLSIAPGNAGHLYTGATTVTASGGTGGGESGGGTAAGGNGGRMTAV